MQISAKPQRAWFLMRHIRSSSFFRGGKQKSSSAGEAKMRKRAEGEGP